MITLYTSHLIAATISRARSSNTSKHPVLNLCTKTFCLCVSVLEARSFFYYATTGMGVREVFLKRNGHCAYI